MKVTKVTYSKVFPLGQYSNEKLSVEIDLEEGDEPTEAFNDAKAYVELSSSQGKEKLQNARLILANEDNYTGIDRKNALAIVSVAERLEERGLSLSPAN